MRIQNILTLVLATAVVVICVVGLFDFDLFVELWIKIFIGVLFAGAIIGVAKSLFAAK